VVLANDGREAVEKAMLHEPDIAILDLAMPVMDGLEAADGLNC
jgi:CheY-like chemotaxis protein